MRYYDDTSTYLYIMTIDDCYNTNQRVLLHIRTKAPLHSFPPRRIRPEFFVEKYRAVLVGIVIHEKKNKGNK